MTENVIVSALREARDAARAAAISTQGIPQVMEQWVRFSASIEQQAGLASKQVKAAQDLVIASGNIESITSSLIKIKEEMFNSAKEKSRKRKAIVAGVVFIAAFGSFAGGVYVGHWKLRRHHVESFDQICRDVNGNIGTQNERRYCVLWE